ncbi:MAG: cytochrome c oxidase subunit II, partial [Merismopedia sp. SIO2A8]|nr:cytochrome c oxidase subunit II [Merismopedia sp. SIO2A8]
TVRLLVTSNDVLHAFAMPAFGVKIDAVPGRINETWFHATKTGIFYGQCSQICGLNHAFMPIAIRVVAQEEFDAWIAGGGETVATSATPEPVQLAKR